MDTMLSPLLDDLRANLQLRLEEADAPACAVSVVPGSLAVGDWCSCGDGGACGMGWVRLDRVYPSGARFPAPETGAQCGGGTVLAAVIEVGVYRCVPTVSGDGMGGLEVPTVAQQTTAALKQATDSLTLFQAIACTPSVTNRKYALGVYTPRDGGDCGGGAWTVTVALTHLRPS